MKYYRVAVFAVLLSGCVTINNPSVTGVAEVSASGVAIVQAAPTVTPVIPASGNPTLPPVMMPPSHPAIEPTPAPVVPQRNSPSPVVSSTPTPTPEPESTPRVETKVYVGTDFRVEYPDGWARQQVSFSDGLFYITGPSRYSRFYASAVEAQKSLDEYRIEQEERLKGWGGPAQAITFAGASAFQCPRTNVVDDVELPGFVIGLIHKETYYLIEMEMRSSAELQMMRQMAETTWKWNKGNLSGP